MLAGIISLRAFQFNFSDNRMVTGIRMLAVADVRMNSISTLVITQSERIRKKLDMYWSSCPMRSPITVDRPELCVGRGKTSKLP